MTTNCEMTEMIPSQNDTKKDEEEVGDVVNHLQGLFVEVSGHGGVRMVNGAVGMVMRHVRGIFGNVNGREGGVRVVKGSQSRRR